MGFSLGLSGSSSRSSSNTNFDQTQNIQSSELANIIAQSFENASSTEIGSMMGQTDRTGTQSGFTSQNQSGSDANTETSRQAQTGSTNTTGTTRQNTQGQELVKQLQTILGTTSQTGTESTQQRTTGSAFADQDLSAIRAVLPQLFGQSMQNFQVASGGALPAQIAAIQRQLTESTLPQIMAGEGAAGSYNATSSRFLANDAIARGAEMAAISQVEAARNAGQATTPLLQLSEILKGAQTSQINVADVLSSMTGTQSQTQRGTTASTTSQNTTGTQAQNTQTRQLLDALTSGTQTSQQNTTGTSAQTTQDSATESQTTQQQTDSTSQSDQTQQTLTESEQLTEEEGRSGTTGRNSSTNASFGFTGQ